MPGIATQFEILRLTIERLDAAGDPAGIAKVMKDSKTVEHTGLNMIFFRAPNMEAWNSVQPDLKRDLEQFSLARVERVIAALQPRHLVVIGLRTFKQLTQRDGHTVLFGQRGNRLAVRGEFGGCPTSGIVHLSGARVSGQDRELLKEFFNPLMSLASTLPRRAAHPADVG